MSEIFGSDATPESTLRFSVDKLYAAGASLGIIESSMSQPKTTYEDLERRAEGVLRRIAERQARRVNLFRRCFLAASIFCAAALAYSLCPRSD